MAQTFLITGANRGIGLEFVRQLAGRAGGDTVIATARHPDRAGELRGIAQRVLPLDVADPESLERFRDQLGDTPIDVLINNAGIASEHTRSLDALDVDEFRRSFTVNAVAPLLLTRAILPNLRAGMRKLIVNLTSVLGSIAQNSGGSSYGYRGSKAALNMLTVCMHNELGREGFTCIVIHPGWVRTDMGGPNATLTPRESVGMMLKTFEHLRQEDSGRFLNYDGTGLPW